MDYWKKKIVWGVALACAVAVGGWSVHWGEACSGRLTVLRRVAAWQVLAGSLEELAPSERAYLSQAMGGDRNAPPLARGLGGRLVLPEALDELIKADLAVVQGSDLCPNNLVAMMSVVKRLMSADVLDDVWLKDVMSQCLGLRVRAVHESQDWWMVEFVDGATEKMRVRFH